MDSGGPGCPLPPPSCQLGQGGEGLSALARVPISAISAGWGQGAAGRPASPTLAGHRHAMPGCAGSGTADAGAAPLCPSQRNPGCTGWQDSAMGAWPSVGAPAVARLAAPGTRRCPCVLAAPGAAHVSSPGAICSPHTSAGCVAPYAQCHAVPSATGCPVPWGTHGSAWRGWRAGRLQESQACAAAGQPERGGCHEPDIRAAHPVPRGTRVVPAPHTQGVRAVPRYGLAEPGSASSPWLGGSRKPPPERGQAATGTVTCPGTDRAHAGRRGLVLPTGPGSPLRRPVPRPRPLPGPAATTNPKGLSVLLSPTEATPVTTCRSTRARGRDEAAAPALLPPPCLAAFSRASVSPSRWGRRRGAARQRKSHGATSPSTVPLVPARQDATGSLCPPLLLATKDAQRGPPRAPGVCRVPTVSARWGGCGSRAPWGAPVPGEAVPGRRGAILSAGSLARGWGCF